MGRKKENKTVREKKEDQGRESLDSKIFIYEIEIVRQISNRNMCPSLNRIFFSFRFPIFFS